MLCFRRKGLRKPEKKYVEYLEGCFRYNGCRRLEKQNHISAMILLEYLESVI